MDSIHAEFIGAPCGSHGPYTFYKAFKFSDKGKVNILSLGEFFFLKLLDDFPVCIGEIQLLWEEKGIDQLLASVRLYFKPRDIPGGTQNGYGFGDDELLAMSEKLIMTLEDLVKRLLPRTVHWDYGRLFKCFYDLPTAEEVITDGSAELCKVFQSNNLLSITFEDVEKEKAECGVKAGDLLAPVVIMTYPKYCRYRAVLKRIETLTDAWLKNTLVMAIGGFSSMQRGMRVMFCREVFEYQDVEDLEFHQEHLAPNLKGRPRKRKLKRDDSDSNDYGSDQSSNASSTVLKMKSQRIQKRNELRNGMTAVHKGNVSEEERVFLKNLYKFMARRNSPIDRLPSLGFKQIDLYGFYKAAKRLGGYNKICGNRLWKVLYDQLGGNTSNTSAATCTRKHYEKLILPYEDHLRKKQLAMAKSLINQRISPSIKLGSQKLQLVRNGEFVKKSNGKSSETDLPTTDVRNSPTRSTSSIEQLQDNSVKTEDVESVNVVPRVSVSLPELEDCSRTSSSTNTTSCQITNLTVQTQTNVATHKRLKVEDIYDVEMKPTFVQCVPPLEVPVVKQGLGTSIMSPIIQCNQMVQHQQTETSQHQQTETSQHHTALSSSSSVLKAPFFPASVIQPSSSSSFFQTNRQQGVSSRQHHVRHFNQHSGNTAHQTTLSSPLSFSSVQKAPMAHNRATASVSQSVKTGSDQILYSLMEGFHQRSITDRHILASCPSSHPLPEPPPAHSNYVKACMPPDDLPAHYNSMHLHTNQDQKGKPDSPPEFPHPDQVFSRIHNQHQNCVPYEVKRHKANSAVKESVLDLSSPCPVGSVAASKDSIHKKSKAYTQASSTSNCAGPSSSLSSARLVSTLQPQQPDVVLQSVLFGAQFTALPRPVKPAEAVQAFVPCHPAFVQAMMSQAFPPTCSPSSLSLYQQSHLSPTAQAQLLAYSEEFMRQKALSSMTGSLSPFLMSTLPGAYPQPSTKDSPQK